MVVDSLLQQLNAEGYLTKGYADDLAMGVTGKHLNTTAELTHGGHRKIDTSCKTKGLSVVNSEKTEVVLFTRKKKTRISRSEADCNKVDLISWSHP